MRPLRVLRVRTGSAGLRGLRADRRGAAAFEFALVMPVLGLFLFGIIKFGLLLHNRLVLAEAVRVTARELAVSRGSTTPFDNANTRFTNAAKSLTDTANAATLTMTVNGVACTANAACATTLGASLGKDAKVAVTKACDLTIMGVNFFKGCSLSSQMTERVE